MCTATLQQVLWCSIPLFQKKNSRLRRALWGSASLLLKKCLACGEHCGVLLPHFRKNFSPAASIVGCCFLAPEKNVSPAASIVGCCFLNSEKKILACGEHCGVLLPQTLMNNSEYQVQTSFQLSGFKIKPQMSLQK